MQEETGWYDYGARMYMPEIGRFFTQDRFSEKYLGLSPYQYTANNPILFIDVNGDSIRIAKGKQELTYIINEDGTSSILDKNGFTYNGKKNKNGEYKGFVGKAQKGLDDISNGGESGKGLVTTLHDDKRDVTIKRGSNRFQAEGLNLTVFWSPEGKSGGLDINGSSGRPAFIGLGHELGHAYIALDGQVAQGTWYMNSEGRAISNAEKFAVHIENTLRSENNIPLRQYYGAVGEGRSLNNRNISSTYFHTRNYNSTLIGSITKQRSIKLPFIYGIHKMKY